MTELREQISSQQRKKDYEKKFQKDMDMLQVARNKYVMAEIREKDHKHLQ